MPTLNGDDDSPQSLLRRACAELDRRLRAGEGCRAEEFFDRYPALWGEAGHGLDLIHTEYKTREELGQNPEREEYYGRFQRWAEQLRNLFDEEDVELPPTIVHHPKQERHSADESDPAVNELIERVLANQLNQGHGDHPTPEFSVELPGELPLTVDVASPGGMPDTKGVADSHSSFPDIPGLECRGELGAGGFGMVFKVYRANVDRVEALKMLRFQEDANNPKLLEMFLREAQAVAKLNHPNVVQFFGLDKHRGRPYFTMEYVAGGSLQQRLTKNGPMAPREAAALLEKLARALQVVHEAGIVHRDLKPGNVLLTEHGQPKLTDFGLAKLLKHNAETIIGPGQVMGTLGYISPEAAAGKGNKVDATADVYGLGAILYHVLTGRPPFEGESKEDVLQKVRIQEPEALGLGSEYRVLEWICFKCLQKDPRQRYESATELADEIRRFLNKERPKIPPPSPIALVGRETLKRRWDGLAAALCLLLPLVLPFMGPRTPEKKEETVGVREQVERQLEAGEKYIYEGCEPLQGPFRWVGKPGLLVKNCEEGYFTVESFGRSMLELVADPGVDRYLVTLEVRDYPAEGNLRSGLFVGLRRHPIEHNVDKMGFYTLFFADHGRFSRRGKDAKDLGYLQFATHVCVQEFEWTNDVGKSLSTRQDSSDAPGHRPGPWRKLGMQVTPQGITAFWLDDLQRWQPVDSLDVRKLERSMSNLSRIFPKAAGIPPAFSPRLGLGLYLSDGRASFRRLEVTPLKAE